MKTHRLKTIQPFFSLIKLGIKTFEVRKNDRDFEIGDYVYLQEYDKILDQYSGHEIKAVITYVLKSFDGLDDGFCVFSFRVLSIYTYYTHTKPLKGEFDQDTFQTPPKIQQK